MNTKFLTLFSFLILVAEPLSAEMPPTRLALGMDAELSILRPSESHDQGNGTFTLTRTGDDRINNADARLSVQVDFGVLPDLWIGARATQGLLPGHSNYWQSGWLFLPFPRINAVATYAVTNWLALGLELPYNPGIAIEVLGGHRFFLGSDGIGGSLGNSPWHLCLGYSYVWVLN